MEQLEAFHESVYDALGTCVTALGGYKKVGAGLWPEKTIDEAAQRLRHCLNADRRETLTPDQVLLILKWAGEEGCHAGMHFIADDCHYDRPRFKTPDEIETELQQQYVKAVADLKQITKRMESLRR